MLVREIRLPIGKGIAGTVAATGEPVILYDAYSDSRFDRSLDQLSGYRTRSMLCVPIRNREGRIVGVLQLLNKKVGSFGPNDLEFLAAISDHMAIAMENATLHLDLLEKNRMERELQLGREIQSRLLPTPPMDIDGTELAARSVPCFEVGEGWELSFWLRRFKPPSSSVWPILSAFAAARVDSRKHVESAKQRKWSLGLARAVVLITARPSVRHTPTVGRDRCSLSPSRSFACSAFSARHPWPGERRVGGGASRPWMGWVFAARNREWRESPPVW